jgi:tetratricopeptide (TPR) repeat protein
VQRLLVEAGVHHQQEQYARAIASATEALEYDGQCAAAYHIRAAAHWYCEQHVEAIEDFTRLLELCPESFAALSGRGQVYAEMGEFELALADLDRSIQVGQQKESPASLAYAQSGRALARAGLDRFDEADSDFDASIVNCPENAWVHYNHALVYHRRGRMSEAARCFELALALEQPRLTQRKRNRAAAFLHEFPPPGA